MDMIPKTAKKIFQNSYFIFQTEIEEWMKILASASYDYMKLMVMELQQKLAEVEELEKIQIQQQQQQQLQKPKETRTNPFDKTDSLSRNLSPSWAQIHARYGAKISSDRDKWCLTLLQS